jgi:hypothetical protein
MVDPTGGACNSQCAAPLSCKTADDYHAFTIVAYRLRLSVELDLPCAETKDDIGAPIHDDYLWRMP